MGPAQLTARSFSVYPPRARQLATRNLAVIRELPLVFAALLLREMGSYDWQFPAEQRLIDDQFAYLQSLSHLQRDQLLRGFASLTVPAGVEGLDWIGHPQTFIDVFTAHLWSSGQINAFRDAAGQYQSAWRTAMPEPVPVTARLCIVVLRKDLLSADYPLFRKLQPHGVFLPRIDPADAWPAILAAASSRVALDPLEYGHWYIDGDLADSSADSGLTRVSWHDVQPIRAAVLARMRTVMDSGHGGPEELRTLMAETTPADLHVGDHMPDDALSRFRISVLTEGSGTQIFSTTFVQWAAREALRRAQPSTLVLRYTPRQRQLPMNELLSGASHGEAIDAEGSLIDADMGAFYTWINLQRLSAAERSCFVVWSEASGQAVAIGPTLAKATTAANSPTMKLLLSYLT
jgi:hypothetical protein